MGIADIRRRVVPAICLHACFATLPALLAPRRPSVVKSGANRQPGRRARRPAVKPTAKCLPAEFERRLRQPTQPACHLPETVVRRVRICLRCASTDVVLGTPLDFLRVASGRTAPSRWDAIRMQADARFQSVLTLVRGSRLSPPLPRLARQRCGGPSIRGDQSSALRRRAFRIERCRRNSKARRTAQKWRPRFR